MQKTRFFSLLLVGFLLPIAPGYAAPLYQFPAGATSLDAPEIVAGYRAVDVEDDELILHLKYLQQVEPRFRVDLFRCLDAFQFEYDRLDDEEHL